MGCLCGPIFEPLSSKPLRLVTIKTLLLLSLATAKCIGELQALSCREVLQGPDFFCFVFARIRGEDSVREKSSSSFLPRQVPQSSLGTCPRSVFCVRFVLYLFQEYEEPVYSYSTYPDRRFSSRYHNILKMSPPFASSEGVSASGDRYQSNGV